jgi:uncharacterized protein YydD (DUF2326 family)
MIHEIYSDLASFKNLEFHSGLNIILVDKSKDATNRQTRNKAGKTSLIELVHLMFGADVDKNSLICQDRLSQFSFGMRFDLNEQEIIVERSCKWKNKVIMKEGQFTNWPISPKWDSTLHTYNLSNEVWKEVLGNFFFKLPYHIKKGERKLFTPTFRSLISYFVRREEEGGFTEPQMNSRQQQLWDTQTAVSYLLGFDLNVPYQFQQVRNREKTVRELKKLLTGQGEIQGIESIGDLRTQAALTERSVEKLKKQLLDFQVLEEYHDLENEARSLTKQISALIDEKVLDREYLDILQESFSSENPPEMDKVIRIYKEALSEVPDMVRRKLEETRVFYESVVRNRRLYLEGEITELQAKIKKKDGAIEAFEKRKSEIMNILNSHGALEQYSNLQAELTRMHIILESTKEKIRLLEQLSETKSEAKLERAKLELMLKKNYAEQAELYNKAIKVFEDFSSQFYENPGSLVIEPTPNGPDFYVKIQGERSKGIRNIQIFCFDMMLMQILKDQGFGPDFLIHDSHLFDGVDERQIATALKIGKETSERLRFQYIVTMNSDVLPKRDIVGIDLNSFKVSVELDDKTDTGGLFGFRF